MGDAKRDARAAAGLRPRCCQIARRGPQDHAVAWLWAGQTPPLEDCRAQPAGLSRRRLTADLAVGRTTLSPLESAPRPDRGQVRSRLTAGGSRIRTFGPPSGKPTF